MNRRDFFKIVTTTAAAATAGCRPAAESILPLVVPNEQMVPGVASWFATVCRECPGGCGVRSGEPAERGLDEHRQSGDLRHHPAGHVDPQRAAALLEQHLGDDPFHRP